MGGHHKEVDWINRGRVHNEGKEQSICCQDTRLLFLHYFFMMNVIGWNPVMDAPGGHPSVEIDTSRAREGEVADHILWCAGKARKLWAQTSYPLDAFIAQ